MLETWHLRCPALAWSWGAGASALLLVKPRQLAARERR